MIEIRRARPDDGEALGEVHAASWEAAYAPFFSPELAAQGIHSRRTRWHGLIAAESGMILVAVIDDRPMALSYTLPSARAGSAEIYSFYGHPAGWGSDAATALMAGTLRHLHDDGFSHVHLWTLRDTPRSRRFYTKCGFTETGATQTRDFGDGNPLPQVEYERSC